MLVEEVLEQQEIAYKMSGRDVIVSCLNPEHDDSNPSMRIDRTTGIYHCFSCGFKGNLFNRFNVVVSKLQIKRDQLAKKLENIRLENIGLTIPEDSQPFLRDYRGIRAETYEKFNAFTHHEEFKSRVVFPIYDITGKISVFNGRAMNEEVKPKYLFFPRHVRPPIYPLTARPKGGSIILVEGIFDMLNMHDKGYTNVMCTFGTTTVTEEKLNLLSLLGCNKLYIFFDGDEAGQKAAEQVKELAISKGFIVENMYWKNQDPGSLSQKQLDKIIEVKCLEY